MAISDKTIQEYRDAIKEEYGAEISFEEAREHVHNFVGFYDLLYKIDRRENPQNYE